MEPKSRFFGRINNIGKLPTRLFMKKLEKIQIANIRNDRENISTYQKGNKGMF